MAHDGVVLIEHSGPLPTNEAPQDWRDVTPGVDPLPLAPMLPITTNELLKEEHHQFYGRPWIMGRFYFDWLLKQGLLPSHRVLDLGCGSGRFGIWLIPFLDEGHYFGIDPHLRSLVAFANYEIVLHGLAKKRPRLFLNGDFNFAFFEAKFDLLLDCYVTRHCAPAMVEKAYSEAKRVMQPGGRVMMPHPPKLGVEGMRALGFELTQVDAVAYPMLVGAVPEIPNITDVWHEFVVR
jgi:SAM-dependent methyltransferase